MSVDPEVVQKFKPVVTQLTNSHGNSDSYKAHKRIYFPADTNGGEDGMLPVFSDEARRERSEALQKPLDKHMEKKKQQQQQQQQEEHQQEEHQQQQQQQEEHQQQQQQQQQEEHQQEEHQQEEPPQHEEQQQLEGEPEGESQDETGPIGKDAAALLLESDEDKQKRQRRLQESLAKKNKALGRHVGEAENATVPVSTQKKPCNLGIVSAILSVLSLHNYNSTFEPFLFKLLRGNMTGDRLSENERSAVKMIFNDIDDGLIANYKDRIIKNVNLESSEFVKAAYKGGTGIKATDGNLKRYAKDAYKIMDSSDDDIQWGYVKTSHNVNCYIIRYNTQLFVVIRNLNDNGGWGGVGGMMGGVMNKFHLQNIDNYEKISHNNRSKIEKQYINNNEYDLPLVHNGYLNMLFGEGGKGMYTYASDKILTMMNNVTDSGTKVNKIIFSGQGAGAALLYMITYQLFQNQEYQRNFNQSTQTAHVVTWNSSKPGNTKFSNQWILRANKAGVKTHTPYLTNYAVEPCLPASVRKSGLSRVYTPVKGFDNISKPKSHEEKVTIINRNTIGDILTDNESFRAKTFPPGGDDAIWTSPNKETILKEFGIKAIPRYEDEAVAQLISEKGSRGSLKVQKTAIKNKREEIGDITKSGMIFSNFKGSSQLGNILVYKTWKIFYSLHCARKVGTSGLCTEIFYNSNDGKNKTFFRSNIDRPAIISEEIWLNLAPKWQKALAFHIYLWEKTKSYKKKIKKTTRRWRRRKKGGKKTKKRKTRKRRD